jgi:hypothetical protein
MLARKSPSIVVFAILVTAMLCVASCTTTTTRYENVPLKTARAIGGVTPEQVKVSNLHTWMGRGGVDSRWPYRRWAGTGKLKRPKDTTSAGQTTCLSAVSTASSNSVWPTAHLAQLCALAFEARRRPTSGCTRHEPLCCRIANP